MKQGEEQAKFVKEAENSTENYIFQKNKITKTATYIIVGFLIILAIVLIGSIFLFGSPAAL